MSYGTRGGMFLRKGRGQNAIQPHGVTYIKTETGMRQIVADKHYNDMRLPETPADVAAIMAAKAKRVRRAAKRRPQ